MDYQPVEVLPMCPLTFLIYLAIGYSIYVVAKSAHKAIVEGTADADKFTAN